MSNYASRVVVAKTENFAWLVLTSTLTTSHKTRYRDLRLSFFFSWALTVRSDNPSSSSSRKEFNTINHAEASVYALWILCNKNMKECRRTVSTNLWDWDRHYWTAPSGNNRSNMRTIFPRIGPTGHLSRSRTGSVLDFDQRVKQIGVMEISDLIQKGCILSIHLSTSTGGMKCSPLSCDSAIFKHCSSRNELDTAVLDFSMRSSRSAESWHRFCMTGRILTCQKVELLPSTNPTDHHELSCSSSTMLAITQNKSTSSSRPLPVRIPFALVLRRHISWAYRDDVSRR